MSSPPQRPSAIAEPRDALAAAIGADQAMTLSLTDVRHRQAIESLWQIDAAMGDVVAKSTEPALGRIKLAWWRERLEDLDRGFVPAEPRLQAVAEHLLPRGVTGAAISGIEPGWSSLFDD